MMTANETTRQEIRQSVRMMYDIQKLRIQTGNRGPNETKTAVLSDTARAYMATCSASLETLEKSGLKEVKRLIKPIPIVAWLQDQKGCGVTLAGVIVSEIDITKCGTASALWRYAGLDVDTSTGKATKRERGKKLHCNPFLKTKLIGVLAPCMIKARSPWRQFYDDYKHRKESSGWGAGKLHRHNAAMRYMIKMFLLELWKVWRTAEGLPTPDPYALAKLGMAHGAHLPNPAVAVSAAPLTDAERLNEAAIEYELQHQLDSDVE
jgi:hypothetical protein